MANRNLKINNDLLKEAKKDGFKLTKRVSQNIRDRLAKQAAFAIDLQESHLVGKGNCATCNEEIDPYKLTRDDMTLVKTVLQYAVTPLQAEDFDSATDEPKSKEENIQSAASVLGNKTWVSEVVKHHTKEALACRDLLNELLPTDSNVTNIQEAV